MSNLNYHHLRLFWAVAREGHLTRASRQLHLTPQTVSGQIRELERDLGEKLFRRAGRLLEMTDMGRIVFGYAEEIFTTGQELVEALRGVPTERPLRLVVGVANVLPKMIVHHLLEPTFHHEPTIRLLCREGSPTELLAELAVHRVDVVLSDGPIPPRASVRAYNHPLGQCGVSFMAAPPLAARLRGGFPSSLDRAPVLLPTEDAAVRSELERWFDARRIRPTVVAEFEDSALLKTFGEEGAGFFAVPSVIRDQIAEQFGVECVGEAPVINERFYAISMERRVRHAGVAAICDNARSELFG